MNCQKRFAAATLSVAAVLFSPPLRTAAQTAAATDTTTKSAPDDEVIVLSPFVVDSTEDNNLYRASSTLAGTRVRTDLRDVASSLSVVTSQFMRDVGATNNQTLLQYTPNTEVGGVYGNYAGVGNTFVNGIDETRNLLRPNSNTRVRGLDSADNTRDYFLSDIPWDSYNTGRIDLQRGPNSILFGIGSPAGIINASINTASFRDEASFQNRVGSYGSVRNSVDVNRVLLKDQLAVRVSLLDDDTKYQQKPAYNRDRRVFAAATWSPKLALFGDSTARTTVRVNFERGRVEANRPRVLPPEDRITPFLDPNGLNKQTWNPWYAWTFGVLPQDDNHFTNIGVPKNYWVGQFPGPGIGAGSNPMFFYDNTSNGANPTIIRQGQDNGWFGLGPDGTRDGNEGGANFASYVGIVGFSDYARSVNNYNPDQYPAADKGFYKDKSLTDPSVFDFFNHLIDGPNKHEWQNWNAYNLSLEQTFLNNRLGLQFVYDHQHYEDGQEENIASPFISVDITSDTMDFPFGYMAANGYTAPYLATANPNAGRAFVGGNGKAGNNSMTSDRENFRATVTGELRAEDFLSHSWLSRLLGRHVFTGLYSSETHSSETRSWARFATDGAWADAVGTGANAANTSGLDYGDRIPDWVSYLSAPLFNLSSPAGLHLQPITSVQAPSGPVTIRYFDSHWKWPLDPNSATYVDPGAPWTNPNQSPPSDSTQSENSANYVGWTNGTFNILNADQGDRDKLYYAGSKIRTKTTSEGLTWQAYLWDGTIVGTVGWRRDRQEQSSGSATYDRLLGYAPMSYGLNPIDPVAGISTGESVSWGVVVHTPPPLRQHLPWGSDISFTYDVGKNTRVENRYGFGGQPLPNSKGKTTDYGFVIDTLNDRLQLKVTWYKTIVSDANISSVTTQATTLGSNTFYLENLEAWGTASALTDVAGMAGSSVAPDWYWNWAYVDHNFDANWDDPNSQAFLNDPSTAAEKAAVKSWLDQMMPQSWYDAFGFPVDVAKAQAGDWANAVKGWSPTGDIGSIQPSSAGMVNGSWPTGTVDNESKGVEIELVGQPLPGWNVSVNASKQTASQTALGADLSNFIEAQHTKFESPAGDLRLWWGGDQTVRDYYNQNIWGAYLFQKGTNGKLVPEMSPWRFNLITSYTVDHGSLRGLNFGGAYRWQQGSILGYALNDAKDNLDVDRPFWSQSIAALDLWLGYERKLSRSVTWRVQLNVRNLGARTKLEPISINPDGSAAGFRIVEGQAWELSNTFSF